MKSGLIIQKKSYTHKAELYIYVHVEELSALYSRVSSVGSDTPPNKILWGLKSRGTKSCTVSGSLEPSPARYQTLGNNLKLSISANLKLN